MKDQVQWLYLRLALWQSRWADTNGGNTIVAIDNIIDKTRAAYTSTGKRN